MENSDYDYRDYDRIWRRVSPDLNPYPEVRAAQETNAQENEADLPGAELNPCCMGSNAQDELNVLEGFWGQELTLQRWYGQLACQVRELGISRLLRRFAWERGAAAGELKAAYYLITGVCYSPAVTGERARCSCLAQTLRRCYHQEACGGFNYARAADETTDPCLQKLFTRLSGDCYRRAEAVQTALGRVLG
jgi:hypothetical protein